MNKTEFRRLCGEKILILDGATGTELIKQGLPSGVSPELFVLENPIAICDIHNAYFNAGSDIVYIPSFGGNRCKLAEFGAAKRVSEINRRLAENAKNNADGKGLVFGDLSPTGEFLKPWGVLEFEELIEIYAEQIKALAEGGADGIVIETMIDLQQTRAALIAAKEVAPNLPTITTLTFDEHGRTLSGNDALSALITLQSLGADAFGCNCSTGPLQMIELIKSIKPYASIPLVAKPNAGMPKLVNDKTVFEMNPEEFGAFALAMRDAGVNLAGGCCGTTPEHIKMLATNLEKLKPEKVECARPGYVSSQSQSVFLGCDGTLKIIGERINPTGKKRLQAELREGKMDIVREFAVQQSDQQAKVLDVNAGLGGIDERATIIKMIEEISAVTPLPLAIDTTNPEVMEAALRRYPGRALVNSISAEKVRLEKMLPIAAKYGAMIIILPVADGGVPEKSAKRIELVKKIFGEAEKYGYNKSDVIIDLLVMSVATGGNGATAALEMAEFASKNFGCGSVCGASNVSFGLPARGVLNSTFLALAKERGLSCAIANPSADFSIFDEVAVDALFGRDLNMSAYLEKFAGAEPIQTKKTTDILQIGNPLENVKEMVIRGDNRQITAAVEAALLAGITPAVIMSEALIAGINVVGEKFSAGTYFLPQLLMSADAMRTAIGKIEPLLAENSEKKAGKSIVVATVEGDIHDIGKNIVCLMLRNYGFDVIDLGKDVCATKIIEAIKKSNAELCGLSALMTTTMPRMKEVIVLARTSGLTNVTFIVGGAAVDAEYAESIGALYAKDAMDTVHLCR